MRLLTRTVVVLAAALLLAPSVAVADPPIRATFDAFGISFVDPVLSAACGTEVIITLDAVFKATLFVDKDGNPVREVDTQPRGRITYSSSATGNSVSAPFATVSHTEYPNGISPGSAAVTTLTGLHSSITGVNPPGAGKIVFNAIVVFVDSSGIPITQLIGPPVSVSGNFAGKTSAICEALA